MVTAIGSANDFIWEAFEESLTPLPADSVDSRVWHALPSLLLLPAGLVTGCLVIIIKAANYALSFFVAEEAQDPSQNFSAVARDARLWDQLGDLEGQIALGHDDPTFLYGTATCTYQDSGSENCPASQWAKWERSCIPDESNRSGKSSDFFSLYQTPAGRKEITDRLHKLGVNSYRFSIEWSHIQPDQNIFNMHALQIYIDLCKHLRDEGIAPMVTLHHFSEPQWFHDFGSFEREENIQLFVDYAVPVFTHLAQPYKGRPLVEHFCTINEPNIEAFSRYVRGSYSPGVVMDFERAGIFLKGALKAHCAVYDALKRIEPNVQIGIVHQRLSFKPTNPLLFLVTRYLNRLINESVLNFFKTGDFEFKFPLICNIVEKNLHPPTDFVGLQYYVRPKIGMLGPTSDGEAMTAMPFHEDPEGLYEAALEVYDAFKKPIIITEMGISTHDNAQRSRFNQRALYTAERVQQAIGKEKLRGYLTWSIGNNFEWDMGMQPQAFGAYPVTGGSIAADPKPGMDTFIRATQAWRRSLLAADAAA
ncbi:MAG: glycoside hydrolase family 1 protein [Chlamydiales bacterium]|nr:glycoside hydrolase family 1 protein [Chlamydiales bacterium]